MVLTCFVPALLHNPHLHADTHTHPSSATIPKHPHPTLSKLSKPAEEQWRELGPDFSAVEEPGGPRDTRVTSIESCSISRAQ